MRARWSGRSREHLVGVREYIRKHNADAAERVRLRIVETVRLLCTLPRLGRAGRKPGTRELVVPHLPYIIVYRIDIANEDELVILGVFHAAQDGRDF
jgi:plasmid stabilization system protein ParE